ncbi:GPP34 family phosphoprotein [Streptomyces sp. SID3212]|uniref:GOLPH3/VPS74 family protein n=1 Tax=Streptomyces sp. SID3212 TaxID=2690259 RepID=UPI00136DE4AF|nr:GPP34 family phosphoprotein [Streptomyces sp. SID3212]MYV56618.1 GPP34 family phosphoprotein [Streptomyces sp. SID3212]
MSTARELLIVAMDMTSVRTVERGALSLALAGAEAIDLLAVGAITLDGDRVVPSDGPGTDDASGDPLLGEALSSFVRQAPYESVGNWLWRRGRNLSAMYTAALEAEGQLVRRHHRRWGVFRSSELVLVDSPARRRAADRWTADEPVLAALATAVGIRDKRTTNSPAVTDEAAATVLTAVDDALSELTAESERRAHKLDDAAITNVRRGY